MFCALNRAAVFVRFTISYDFVENIGWCWNLMEKLHDNVGNVQKPLPTAVIGQRFIYMCSSQVHN